jgi:surface polysaccharide O-acyltransferase-like enzyme
MLKFVFAVAVIRFLTPLLNKKTENKWKEIIKIYHKNWILNWIPLAKNVNQWWARRNPVLSHRIP